MTRAVRKHVKWWGFIFLPIVLRALVPVGFMPMFGPGFRVELVVCDGYSPLPWTTGPSMSMEMPSGMPMDTAMGSSSSHGGHPHHEDHGNCPYGSSPALAALPVLAALPLPIDRAVEPAVGTAQIADFRVSFRAQSPRGPPA